MKIFLFLLFALISLPASAETSGLKVHGVLESILKEMQEPGSTPEVYPLAENYRLDLTLFDLIDQTTIILDSRPPLNARLKKTLYRFGDIPDFKAWYNELEIISTEYPEIQIELNRKLFLQFYTPSGVALFPRYKTFDMKRFRDNAKLQRIRHYNKFAADPEAAGLLLSFKKNEWKGFYTNPLTVAKLRRVSYLELWAIHDAYYKELIKLYVKHDPGISFQKSKTGLIAIGGQLSARSRKLFRILHELPTKHQVFLLLSQKLKNLPFDSGLIILTPTFIQTHEEALSNSLREITLDQLLHSDDDQYLLAVRNFMKNRENEIEEKLAAYNASNSSQHKIIWKNRSKKPRRLEALASIDTLLLFYPHSPWFTGEYGNIIDRKGKQIYLGENNRHKIGRLFRGFRKTIFFSENYLSFLAGGVALAVTDGNLSAAMTTRNLVRSAIRTSKYDREWKEFINEVPHEVLNAMLLSSGATPGRFFKVLALGSGQGLIQSLITGQDLRTGAAVGAGLSLLQFYLLPTSWARPMTSGYDAKALSLNRKLELLEGSIRGLTQGAVVAAIEGENIRQGALKGGAFGFISTQMIIWFLGTRYNPFKGWTDGEVDEMIKLENEFQNTIGRGGEYAIDRQLIMDANFRVGGLLPRLSGRAVALPGNVVMNNRAYNDLSLLTHEASHLMQQHQSGVFGFYLFRYIPTYLRVGYNGHPDENFIYTVLRGKEYDQKS